MTVYSHKTMRRCFSYPIRQILRTCIWCCLLICCLDVTLLVASEFTDDPILRLETGQHTAGVRRISIDARQRFLVSGSYDKTARVYDMKTGMLLQTLRIPIQRGHVGKIYAVAISPDGETVAISGCTGKESEKRFIYILKRTGAMVKCIGGLPIAIGHLTYSPDGRYLAVTLKEANGIRIYETRNYQQIASDADYRTDSWGCSFDSSNHLVTTSLDGYVRLYNADFKLIQIKSAPGGSQPYGVAFSPGGHKIAVGYHDSTRVDVLSADDLSLLFSANTDGVDNGCFYAVTWSTDGRYLYAGGYYQDKDGWNPIRRWDKGGRGEVKEFRIATDTIMGFAPLENGRLAVGAQEPLVGVLGNDGDLIWKYQGGIADFRDQTGAQGIRLSKTGDRVLFWFELGGKNQALFSLPDAQITLGPSDDKTLLGPITEAKGIEITDWTYNPAPKLNGNPLSLDQYERSCSLAISPDGSHFLLGADWSLRCFDPKGKQVWKEYLPETAFTVTISDDRRIAVAGLGDGTLRWYRMTDGKELLALFVHPNDKRWVLWTPQGYYRASAGGEDLIGWHINNGADKAPDFFGASRFREQFYRPDVIDKVIETLDVEKALQLADKVRGQKTVTRDVRDILPPVVSILAPRTGTKQTDTKLVLTYKAESAQGEIKSMEAKVDGRPAKVLDDVPNYDKTRQSVVGQITIEIPAQNCSVTLIATNQNGASEPAQYYVTWEGSPDWYKPKLYVLAIGVNDYKDDSYDGLKYCAKDAEDFVNAVKRQEGGLYQKVSCRLLDNDKAKRDAILDGLDWLQHETTSRDVAMVFLSGHGKSNPRDGKYQFLPHDADHARLNRTTVDGSDLNKFLGDVNGKAVLFLDTCHSGKLMSGQKGDDTRPDIDRLANELAGADTGVIVFASSSGKQLSIEDEKWGNGAFTSALIEGIDGQADYTKDWHVSIAELEVWIPNQVKKLTEGSQTPVTAKPKAVEDLKVFHVIQEKKGEGKK